MRHRVRTLIRPFLLCFLLAVAFRAVAQQVGTSNKRPSNVMLGVLEDHPGVYTGDPNFWRVRALFEKKGSEWKAFPNPCRDVACLEALPKSYPKEVNWTITFDGRNLGQVTARTPPEFLSYDSVGYEEITTSGSVPTVGKRSEENAGFLFAPAYRPLVAVSKPHFRDPDVWKPSRLSAELVSALRRSFDRDFRKFPIVETPMRIS